jgi:anti-sigma factor RsiW
MHQVIVESLEEYIGGDLAPSTRRDFEAHLEACEECKREVNGMLELSGLFVSLRSTEEIAPPPEFCAQVFARVSKQQTASFWTLFSLDATFGRRVVFASLMTLAVLGSFLVSREVAYSPGPARPESVMAEQAASRDTMLVTLTSYEP